MKYRVVEDETLLFIMDKNYKIDYIIDEENETLVITKKDENRQPIS